jgi:sulfur transfer complex TusBCD TusB component (DsrH family)
MADKFLCYQCGREEAHCRCEVKKYCVLCQGGDDVRLCGDGQYYCLACREACDYEAQH